MAFGRKFRQILREVRAIYRCRKRYQSFAGIRHGDRFEYLNFPITLWATKSYDFWVLLPLVLHKLRPRNLLELGSGRSTIYLSEYAGKTGAHLVSVDQNPGWVALNTLICRFGGHDEGFLHRVDLQDDGFYSVDQLRQLIDRPDFVFIDGPTRRGSTPSQMAWLTAVVQQARVIVLDDVHRRHIYRQIAPIAAASDCRNMLFQEYLLHDRKTYHNCLCILADDATFPLIEDAVRYLDIAVRREYSLEDCAED